MVHCYNQVAESYAAARHDELAGKPFERLLLAAFAVARQHSGPMADFGCGPGQTTGFLYHHGIQNITGIDISPAMVEAAGKLHPQITFETGNLLDLSWPAHSFGSALAFYAIVHFTREEIKKAFSEVRRVLKDGGQFLFSFHVGDDTVHYDKAHNKDVDVNLYYFQPEMLIQLLHSTGFRVIDALERYPYKDEYQSKRGYIWAETA